MKVPEPKKLKSGTWFLQLRLNGVSKTFTSHSKSDCKRQAELYKAEYRSNKRHISQASSLSVGEAVDKYISQQFQNGYITERTLTCYEQIRNNRFQELMKVRICDLTNSKLQEHVNAEQRIITKNGKKISVDSVRRAYSLIRSSIHGCSPELNTEVKFNEKQRTFRTLLQPEDVYKAVHGTDVELPVLLAMWLSLSMSEIRGLTKSKSIRGNQLYIVETVVDCKMRDKDGNPVPGKQVAIRK